MESVTSKSSKKLSLKKLVLAVLKQNKADRDNRKVLCPAIDKAVNVYSKILTDHPAPVTRGTAK